MCLYVSNATASGFTHLVLFTYLVHFFISCVISVGILAVFTRDLDVVALNA